MNGKGPIRIESLQLREIGDEAFMGPSRARVFEMISVNKCQLWKEKSSKWKYSEFVGYFT